MNAEKLDTVRVSVEFYKEYYTLKTQNAELLEALECIAYGCSFPEDAVQRACRDRANEAIRKARGE